MSDEKYPSMLNTDLAGDETSPPQGSTATGTAFVRERLEYLRGEIEAERISWSEIAELQGLVEHIDPTDVVLLQWAGVPEFPSEKPIVRSYTAVFTIEHENPSEEAQADLLAYMQDHFDNQWGQTAGSGSGWTVTIHADDPIEEDE